MGMVSNSKTVDCPPDAYASALDGLTMLTFPSEYKGGNDWLLVSRMHTHHSYCMSYMAQA